MFFLLDNFLPFYPLTAWKMKISKKQMKKTPGDIIILHKCTTNHDHMLYCSQDMACDTCNYHFSFWAVFCPFMPQQPKKKKSKFQKNEKNFWRCHHFTHEYLKLWLDDVNTAPEFLVHNGWTDGQTDRQKKWHLERWVPHLKIDNWY